MFGRVIIYFKLHCVTYVLLLEKNPTVIMMVCYEEVVTFCTKIYNEMVVIFCTNIFNEIVAVFSRFFLSTLYVQYITIQM